MNNLIVILLSSLIYLPGTTVGNFIRSGITFFSYLMVSSGRSYGTNKKISSVIKCMVISPFVPVIFVLISGDINSAVIFHEVMRMFYCALLIMTVSKLYISFDTRYLGAIIAFLPNFVIKLLEYIKLPGIIPFISQ